MAFGAAPRPFDVLALVLSLGITVLSALAVYGGGETEPRVIIEGEGTAWNYPLDADESIRVPGPLGETVVVIEHGNVHIEESPCNNQTCIAAGEIHNHGQWVACLPNGVFVRVEGKEREDGIDATTW